MIRKIFLSATVIFLTVSAGVLSSQVDTSTEIVKSTETSVVDIYAGTMRYDRKEDTVTARDSVKMEFGNLVLTCDEGTYRRKKNLVRAEGNIKFDTPNYHVEADSLEYHIAGSTGVIYNTTLTSKPLYIYADLIKIVSEDEFLIPRGGITTCDHQPPHYQFTGTDMRVKLDSSFSAYNAILRFGSVPAFYYPYYKQNLGPEKGGFDLDLGRSNSEGYYAKAKLSYPFSENSRTHIGLDLMTEKGIGFTGGHTYNTDRGTLDLDATYIRDIFKEKAIEEELDMDIDDDEFILNLRGWQEIYDNLSVRYRSDYTSSRDYNYLYRVFSEEEYHQQELFYRMGLEYSNSNYLASVYGTREEQWINEQYEITEIASPGAKLKLYPVRLGSFNFSSEFNYKNRYVTDNRTMQPYFTWDNSLETSYRVDPAGFYYFSFSPGVGYDGYYKRNKLNDDYLKHQGKFFTGFNQGFFKKLFLNTDYSFKKNIQPPYDITENTVRGRIMLRPYSFLRLSSQSRYNFKSQSPGNSLNELNLNISPIDFNIRNRFDYERSKNLEWLFDVNYKNTLGTRVKYIHSYSKRLEVENSLRFAAGSFNIFGGITYDLEKMSNGKFYKFSEFTEKQLTLNWDMHCWESEYKVIKRGKDIQFWILFNIEAFPDDKAGLFGKVDKEDETDVRFHRE
ncbi:MAG: hypothetical protein ACQEQC_04635 [Elusimicrobiota bacterium]